MTSFQEPQLADPKLLEKIDKLFELNIGEHVDLPQLLVVGDQSSGKSSVLAGLTGIEFPTDSSLCTRFATQIIFRRSIVSKRVISVIPAADSSREHKRSLRKWGEKNYNILERKTFAEILTEVQRMMGIGHTTADQGVKSFSKDILKIEMSGPDQQHLSFVDVPGIFKHTTQGVTTRQDIEWVRSMVEDYMSNARSIILAVVAANVDIANQEILEMAKEYDPAGRRTLGILTKPDIVDKGAESKIIDIIEGRTHDMKLGWSVVRNPGQKEIEDTIDREKCEVGFFETVTPWSSLAKDRVGIPALKTLLEEILGGMINREFSKVKKELRSKMREKYQEIKELGPPRDSQLEQSNYLLELANRFQYVLELALAAHYAQDDVFHDSEQLKLATSFVNRNIEYTEDLAAFGHTIRFKNDEDTMHESEYTLTTDSQSSNDDFPGAQEVRRNKRKFEEIDDILSEDKVVYEPDSRKDIITWLSKMYKSSRGLELGTFDPSLLAVVWKQQSKNWEDITSGYISDIVTIVHSFLVDLLGAIVPDEGTSERLLTLMIDELEKRYLAGIEHAKFLLFAEHSGTLMTTNHYFADNLEKSRQERVRAQLKTVAVWSAENKSLVVPLKANLPVTNASNNKHTVSDLHDILKSYYKVARKRLVDNVIKLAAEHYLVKGKDSPLRLFSSQFVSEMTKDQLEYVASEDGHIRRKRRQLSKDIENLKKGEKVLAEGRAS